MKPLDTEGFTAAKDRMRHVYSSYDKVVVSYSVGKDSTCVLEVGLQVAASWANCW